MRLGLAQYAARQLGDIRRNPPRLIFGEQLGCRSPARLIFEIDKGELLPGVVNETLAVVLVRPGRREETQLKN
jgi:hypothetical protein